MSALMCFQKLKPIWPLAHEGIGMTARRDTSNQFAVIAIRGLLLVTLSIALLAACATPSMRSADSLVAPEDWFEQYAHWRMQGRIALSDGESGGQLSIGWRHNNGRTAVDLRSGLGGQWWRLSFDETEAELAGSEQPKITATNPEALIHEATGWPIPVTAFAHWAKGLSSPTDQGLDFDEAGRLVGLNHDGWTVVLGGYEASWGEGDQAVMLPSRFEFAKAPYRVRLVLNRWEWLKSEPAE